MRNIIKQIIPPFILLLYRRVREYRRQPGFSGVYHSINEISDENPWIQEEWIKLSQNKVDNIVSAPLNNFMPSSDFGGYFVLPCLIINLMSQSKSCNVLDFGGGTGLIFFKIFPYLIHPENVMYHIVDNNAELYNIGEKHAKSIGVENRITFHPEIPKIGIQFDILYINTSLQYIYDYLSLLTTLLQSEPKYVILTRLVAGDMKTYITKQNIYGYTTPYIFINFQEIVDIFSNNGYRLIFKSPCVEDVLEGEYDDIPENLRIHNTANLIFRQFD
jgi:putative methyltransferase (TIGR04325 family)